MESKKLAEFLKYFNNLKRDEETIYIICPDSDCKGFTEEHMWCESSGTYYPKCPSQNKAYKILHCHRGHPNKLEIDLCSWTRVGCSHENCHAASFHLMSGKYSRILLEFVEEFLKKEFVKK